MPAQSGLGFSGIAAIQIPDEGATGFVLTKLSPDDYDYDWLAGGGGGPTVDPGTIDDTILRWNTVTPAWEEFTSYILPLADGSDGQAIITDGAGTLSFATVGGGGLLSGQYRFSSSTVAADPGPGRFRYDTGSYGTVTQIFIDDVTNQGVDISNILSIITTGDRLYIQAEDDSDEWAVWQVTAPSTDNTGWFTLDVTVENSGNFLTNNDRVLFVLDIQGAEVVTLQSAYENATTPPQISVNGTPDPITIDATVTGDLFALRNVGNNDVLRAIVGASDDQIDIGDAGVNGRHVTFLDTNAASTGPRPGIEIFPDGVSYTSNPNTGVIEITGASTNLQAAGVVSFGGALTSNVLYTQRFNGFGFNNGLIFVHGNRYRNESGFAANFGSFFTLVDQPLIEADGSARTGIIQNSVRAQPRFGAINGGSLAWTSVTLYETAGTVSAGATIATWRCFRAGGVGSGGGAITDWFGLDIVDPTIVNPGSTTGIRCNIPAAASHLFIEHTGTANSTFAGPITMNNAVELRFGGSTADDVAFSRTAADTVRMAGAESLDWDFNAATNNIRVSSASGASINLNTLEFAFGPSATADGTNNWIMAISPGLRATNLGGDYSEVLFTSSSSISIAHAIGTFATWTINASTAVLGAGSITNMTNVLIQTNPNQGTGDRTGLRITSNPSGGGGVNAALYVTAGLSRFDGRVDINNGIALGGGAAATLGTIGGSGPTAAAQAQWLEVDIGGTAHWIPVWT